MRAPSGAGAARKQAAGIPKIGEKTGVTACRLLASRSQRYPIKASIKGRLLGAGCSAHQRAPARTSAHPRAPARTRAHPRAPAARPLGGSDRPLPPVERWPQERLPRPRPTRRSRATRPHPPARSQRRHQVSRKRRRLLGSARWGLGNLDQPLSESRDAAHEPRRRLAAKPDPARARRPKPWTSRKSARAVPATPSQPTCHQLVTGGANTVYFWRSGNHRSLVNAWSPQRMSCRKKSLR
ncbi:MAG: hypothetical protein RL077_2168 [Verrucomicrobiota bacterium]